MAGRPKGDTPRMRELREKGLSNRLIAKRLGYTTPQVLGRLHYWGYRGDRLVTLTPWEPTEKAFALQLYKEGASFGAIAGLLGRTRNSIAGLVWRNNGQRSKASNQHPR